MQEHRFGNKLTMAQCGERWRAADTSQSQWNAKASRGRAAAKGAGARHDSANAWRDEETPFGMGSNSTPIREDIIMPLMSTNVRQTHAAKWRRLCEPTITPRANDPEPLPPRRLCSSIYGPGMCAAKIPLERKVLFDINVTDVDLITSVLGKLKHAPIFTILYEGALAAAAPTPTRVGLLMCRSYISPPTYSVLRLQSGGLPAPGDVLHFTRDIMKRHSIAMQMAGVPRAWKYFRHDYVPVRGPDRSLCFQITSTVELVPSEFVKVALKADGLATALSMARSMFKPEPTARSSSARPTIGSGRGRGARGRGRGRGAKEAAVEAPHDPLEAHDDDGDSDARTSDLDEWEAEEARDRLMPAPNSVETELLNRLDPRTGHVVDVNGDWVGTITYIYLFSSPLWSIAVFCRRCKASRRTTQTKNPSKVMAIRWILDCESKFHRRQVDHLAHYDNYVLNVASAKPTAKAAAKTLAKAGAKPK